MSGVSTKPLDGTVIGAARRAARRVVVGSGVAATLAAALLVAPGSIPSVHAKTAARTNPDLLLPAPFKAEYQQAGDFDGDGDLDAVIVGVDGVVPTPDESGTDDPDGVRILLFARHDADGYRTAGIGRRAVMCRRCGGAFWGVIPSPIDLILSSGSSSSTGSSSGTGSTRRQASVAVEQTAGAREVTTWTHRYRFEQGKVRLIGVDVVRLDRGSGGTWKTSTNYLTGVTVVTVDGTVEGASRPGTTKRSPRFITLETVDFAAA